MQEQDWGDEELWIVTASDRQEVQPTGQKSPTRDFNPYNNPSKATVSGEEVQASRVKAETLAVQMSQFVRIIGRVFATAQQQIDPLAGLQLDEIKLAVEISGKGEIKLLGTGIETSGKGAIELKFKRIDPSK
ncbi:MULTISPECIES: hypothetical protein [Pseudanabaena]|jgi:hypothetical protein|uniref:Pepco domain-containing protein n=1 Tax=Pseudanabaena TaxID=1152 RepID=UPI00247A8090|nr:MULTISPECIES: hypothetical protein [Pseudanabaena]MEA5487117.1 hypothetical protein [Pseudanabaena sp. CCNP1317]WGS70924.1 hypothetical protein OA858_14475 [Pseudanabaena galeata CCNP1313]